MRSKSVSIPIIGLFCAALAQAEVKPANTVLASRCGKVVKGSTGTEKVAVEKICYARVEGIRPVNPFLEITLNDGSNPKLYSVAYALKASTESNGNTSRGMVLSEVGIVVKGMAKMHAKAGSKPGSAIEVKDKQGAVIELRKGKLPGNLKFEARDFEVIYHTQ